ncbi:MAG: hypothetical protein HC769_22760 [Cyanobacteria bacterium CRU_2_1]|nr:hypothetical protein [Cyanobacteria bacterium RU_5_0]NJR61405.1 hypothetical protein [Cyanobacteria bacterium CRU_2_1]
MSMINHSINDIHGIANVVDLSNDAAANVSGGASTAKGPAFPGEHVDVILYSGANFTGRRLEISTGGDLAGLGWANRASSVYVPKTTQRSWVFTTRKDGKGLNFTLKPGQGYRRLGRTFDNNIEYTKSVPQPGEQ